jgi:uncharacterized protein YcnI
MSRTLRVAAASAAATVVAVLGFAGAASAHVSVSPAAATAGGNVRIAFLVPTESDTASTVKLEVQVPTDKPIAGLATAPVPGWTVTTKTTRLATPVKTDEGDTITDAVSLITWTAGTPDAGIRPGQFQEFPVSLEGLPDTDRIVFKVLQTYSDGTVVRWIDEPVAGQPEPEHPAPVLTLTKDGNDRTAPSVATRSSGGAPLAWSIVAVVLGLAGAVLGGLAYLRTRRTAG